jgi:hypothetical protein
MSREGSHLSASDIRARIIQDGVARQHFEQLNSKGVHESVLLGMLVNLGNYSPAWDAFKVNTSGLDRRQVRAAAKKIRNAADLMRKTRWLLFTKDLSLEQETAIEGPSPPLSLEALNEFRGLPKSVLEFADGLERALRRPEFSPQALTIRDSALVMLLVYLKKITGGYQDSAVCELLRAGLNEEIDETALNQWRYRHKKLIDAKVKFKPRPAI